MQTGEICSQCVSKCQVANRKERLVIVCPVCEGTDDDCDFCDRTGDYHLVGCPLEEIGYELCDAIEMASLCERGDWPVRGGILDQSSWFVAMRRELKVTVSRIQDEQIKR